MKIKSLIAMLLLCCFLPFSVSAAGVIGSGHQSIKEYFESGSRGFSDTQGHWAAEDIYEAVDLGLVSGTSATTFSPDLPMTRAMLVTLLYRMANSPAVSGKSTYRDVAEGAWYAKPVLWTVENGISYGISDLEFGINATATREQIVTMLYRFARVCRYDVSQYAGTSVFSDSDQISASARAAVCWAVAQNLISGKQDQCFAPADGATRAEVVSICMRFLRANQK